MSDSSDTGAASPLPLAGIRVLDLASRSAPHCGQLLALFGAEVAIAEPPAAASARADLAWLAFNAGKRSLACDPADPRARDLLGELAARADVLIEGDAPLPGFRPSEANPQLVHAIVSPFGLSGPRAAWKSSELVAQAAGGILYLSGDRDHPPAQVGIPLALGMAGAQAACAVLLALARRARTGRGARIDVSQQEAVANLLFVTQFMAHVGLPPGKRGEAQLTLSGKKLTRRVLWPCADGWATWAVWTGPGMGPKNRETFEWIQESGVPEAAELLAVPWARLSTGDLTPELLEKVNRVVGDFFAKQTKETIDREALARRILLQAVESPADVLRNEQLRARGAFRSFELPDGRTAEVVATPVRSSAYVVELARRAPALGADTEAVRREWLASRPRGREPSGGAAALPLDGLRVLDLGWAVVSPVVTKYLAMFGADVVRVEHRKRPCPVRMTGPYPLGKPSLDGSASFVSINASKRSVGIDLSLPNARELVQRLAEQADVVCENFAPGVADRLGYGYATLRSARPDLIMLSLSMQGQNGPRAGQPGLGNHLQAMCAIDHLTGFPDGPPGGPNQVMPDFIGPWVSLAAVLAALEHRRNTGEGQHIDVSQLEAILLYVQPRLLEQQLGGASPARAGNASPVAAPHGVYPVQGHDRWIAIAIQSDAEWQRLRALAPPALRERFSAAMDTPARLRERAALDAAIAAWTASCAGDSLMSELQQLGIAAYTVNDGLQMLADPQLAFRSHYRTVEHAKLGAQLVDAPAFRFDDLEPRIAAGPLYAAHTEEVLAEWLGLEGDAMAEWIAGGVLDF